MALFTLIPDSDRENLRKPLVQIFSCFHQVSFLGENEDKKQKEKKKISVVHDINFETIIRHVRLT